MKNNVLTKTFICLIIIVILFNWISSYVVFAESTQDTLTDIKVSKDSVSGETYRDLRQEVVENFKSQLSSKYGYSGTTEELAEALRNRFNCYNGN